MFRLLTLIVVLLLILTATRVCVAEEELFEDKFDRGLSPKWTVVGLKREDYRLKNGGLEMRVQPGKSTKETPMLMVLLPFKTSESVTASVEVTVLDHFTEPAESAGLFLTDEHGGEFSALKMNVNGHLVFSPPQVEFIGKEGTEGDPQQYSLRFWPANDELGALRILVRDGYGYFQIGPSAQGKYLNAFHSALRPNVSKRGFALSAYGGPSDQEHWVRFDNFRVVRNK